MDELTTAEAAAQLGVSKRRVLQYIHEKRLVARKLAGAWFVSAASLAAFQCHPVGRPAPPHKDAALARYEGGDPVRDIAADVGTTEAAIYKRASRACRYRKPERRAAYEVALAMADGLDNLWEPDAHLDVALGLDHDLPREVRKRIAAKAVMVVRGQRRKAAQ